MRYVYVKNGDAVDQVRRICAQSVEVGSGPDAFIADFLKRHSADDVLVLCRTVKSDAFRSNGIRTKAFKVGKGPLYGTITRIWAAIRIALEILHFRPDRILCGTSREQLWICAAMARLLGASLVLSRHNELNERGATAGVVAKLNRVSVRSSHGIVCHGPFLADQIVSTGFPKERTWEFEVDLNGFLMRSIAGPLPEPIEKFLQRFSIIAMFVGRIQADKGVMDLLEAFAGLPDRRVGLVYVGDGADAPALRRRVDEVGSSVYMTGRVAHAELQSIMRRATVVVTPTRPEFPEGRCMVVLESLVLGIPVIAPRSGPFPYAIEHGGNGLLFEPGSRDSLRECLAQIVDENGTLGRLRSGAAESSTRLLTPKLSFGEAVDKAFSPTVHTE